VSEDKKAAAAQRKREAVRQQAENAQQDGNAGGLSRGARKHQKAIEGLEHLTCFDDVAVGVTRKRTEGRFALGEYDMTLGPVSPVKEDARLFFLDVLGHREQVGVQRGVLRAHDHEQLAHGPMPRGTVAGVAIHNRLAVERALEVVEPRPRAAIAHRVEAGLALGRSWRAVPTTPGSAG
jgi:hypothetical protein